MGLALYFSETNKKVKLTMTNSRNWTFGKRGIPVRLMLAAAALAVLGAAQLIERPLGLQLVGVMHENLAVINRIDDAVTRGDYDRIPQEVVHLKANAHEMKKFDLSDLGLDPDRDAEFDGLLTAQMKAADAIGIAAEREDAPAVLFGVQQLFRDACIRCHENFRNTQALHAPSVILMRTMLGIVQDMNRGLARTDYAQIAREARKLEAMADVFTTSQVIDEMFEIDDPAERLEFRHYLHRLSTEAIRVESSAVGRDSNEIALALRRMMEEGCISCHKRFRDQN